MRWRWSAPNGAVGQISASRAGVSVLADNLGKISVALETRPRFGFALWPIGRRAAVPRSLWATCAVEMRAQPWRSYLCATSSARTGASGV